MTLTEAWIIAAAATFVTAAGAEPLVDNLAQPTSSTTVLGTVAPDAIWAAQSFGSGGWFSLDSIETLLGEVAGDPFITLELRVGTSAPGSLLTTFTVPGLSPGPTELVTIVPTSTVVLRPGETYWLVMGASVQGSFGWSYADGNGYVGSGSFGNYSYSEDQGATWSAFNSDDPYKMRVNGTAACPADLSGSSDPNDSAYGIPDGFVDASDFFFYLDKFVAGDLAIADLSGSSDPNDPAYGMPDGTIDASDFFYYLDLFVAPCP